MFQNSSEKSLPLPYWTRVVRMNWWNLSGCCMLQLWTLRSCANRWSSKCVYGKNWRDHIFQTKTHGDGRLYDKIIFSFSDSTVISYSKARKYLSNVEIRFCMQLPILRNVLLDILLSSFKLRRTLHQQISSACYTSFSWKIRHVLFRCVNEIFLKF